MTESSGAGQYLIYIRRDEENRILAAVDEVQETGQSQALLLYGIGGVGKTRMVRALAEREATGPVTWLQPIDVDDPEYYLLTNLQANVARQLDPAGEYFKRYTEYLASPPKQTREHVTPEAVVSHLSHVRRIFVECYKNYVEGMGKTVVMTFDTVEAIRGRGLLMTLTREWMASLPQTLFILSGRPASHGGLASDPIYEQLADAHDPMPVTQVDLKEFPRTAAQEYLSRSGVAVGLTEEELEKFILLTQGHPLWLALTVSYLSKEGMPDEAQTDLAVIERNMPFHGTPTTRGRQLQEEFKRRLLSPYSGTDFWHDTVLRLAAVRQGVSEPIWRRLMSDLPFPETEAGTATPWQQLMDTPWIRLRANGRYVTLHDAMAEELARFVLPAQDKGEQWRHDLWQRVVEIYGEQIEDWEQRLTEESGRLEARRQLFGGSGQASVAPDAPPSEPAELLQEATRIGAGKREIDRLKTARFFYQLLCDFPVGCQYFLKLFEQAKKAQDLLFQDLLATVMLRCLGASDAPVMFDDAASKALHEFRRWLADGQQALHREIGITLSEFLVASGQAALAVSLLLDLPLGDADPHLISRQKILLANAYLRVPGEVKEGLRYLDEALQVAADAALEPAERQRLAAEAYKEQGFYRRSRGLLDGAEEAYGHARDAIETVLSTAPTIADRKEKASIQSNWAYVKGLNGFHQDALELVESAINVRERFDRGLPEGISLSVKGEVFRYQQKFRKAWEAYAEAERIFGAAQDQPWLGTIYQQQAICLYQAYHDGETDLVPGNQLEEAGRLAHLAVEICRERSVRNYPSALNRAARIIGDKDADAGLKLLVEGIGRAQAISDGWFSLANLVEFAELSYRTWRTTGQDSYRDEIARYEPHFRQVISEYEFPDLRGRWEVVAGHLRVHEWVLTDDDDQLDLALRYYADGFKHIAERGHVGSSGAAMIRGTFVAFRELVRGLPVNIRDAWVDHLRREWSGQQAGSTILLALLEELY
jgi:tetratricopeptide (TPR) repeat protein